MRIIWITLLMYVVMLSFYAVAMAGCEPVTVKGPVPGDKIGSGYSHTLPSLQDHQVVLTFDDGPNPTTTPKVLKILHDRCLSAVFFLIGQNASRYPQIVRSIVNDGHSVGSHSWSHPQPFERLSDAVADTQIENGLYAVNEATSSAKPWFRYPGFGHNHFTEGMTTHLGLTVWSADIDPRDWAEPGTDVIIERILHQLSSSHKGIIVLHDIHATTVRALPSIIKALQDNNYQIVGVK